MKASRAYKKLASQHVSSLSVVQGGPRRTTQGKWGKRNRWELHVLLGSELEQGLWKPFIFKMATGYEPAQRESSRTEIMSQNEDAQSAVM